MDALYTAVIRTLWVLTFGVFLYLAFWSSFEAILVGTIETLCRTAPTCQPGDF